MSVTTPYRRRSASAIARLSRDDRGAAAVEFALIGLACLLLIIETMQAGLYFYTSASLDTATTKAMRQVMTGKVTNSGLTAAQFRSTVLCPLLPTAMSCSNVISNLQPVSEAVSPGGFYAFVNATQTGTISPTMDTTQTSFCPGTTGGVVYAQIFYAMPVFSPFWRLVNSTNWNGSLVHFVSSAAAFKSEPYPTSQQPAC